ncbi:MAG: TrmH family RNA methyltransferase, partial [Gammaproteobacteria bacterium]
MLDRVRVVLVGTAHPGNIGGAARAMKNMGLGRLYLAAPVSFPHPESTWRAVQATDVLESAVVTRDLA